MEVILEEILILCIGDSKLIGDSLGPLVGSFLEKNKIDIGNNVKVLGTLEKPIGYTDLIDISEHINCNKEYYTTIVTIDSALGSNQNIGKILIDNTTLCAGSGVNRGKKLIGDISIRGIVGKNYNNVKQNIIELESVSTDLVESMACKIIFTLSKLFRC